MNKQALIALFLAPAVCMNVYADNVTTAKTSLQGAMSELATLASNSQQKEIEQVINDLHALLARVTPGILTALEPLTNDERMVLISQLSSTPEFGAMVQAAAPLSQSKAVLTLAPIVNNEDAAGAVNVISYQGKMKLIDIVANLTKISIGLGADQMLATMASGCDDDDEYEDEDEAEDED